MRDIKFRQLEANDIECRVAHVTGNGVQLLLYKNARCDMAMLDDTVGPANWQRTHEVVNGNLFCSVGINVADDGQDPYWVWKQDVGTESNTEKEKGEASDSFKRACFNWGIGRELYTAPFIWIPASKCRIEQDPKKPDRSICKDSFSVDRIEYKNKKISFLTILNNKRHEVVWSLGNPPEQPVAEEKPMEPAKDLVTKDMVTSLETTMKEAHVSRKQFLDMNNLTSLADMNINQYKNTMDALHKKAQIARRKDQKNNDEELPFA